MYENTDKVSSVCFVLAAIMLLFVVLLQLFDFLNYI